MKYNAKIVEEICKHLRMGMTQKDSCVLVGISGETFNQWKNNRPDFSDAVEKAQMDCKQRNIGIIQKAALTTWQAAAWWMERKHKDEYAQKVYSDVSMNFASGVIMDMIRAVRAATPASCPHCKTNLSIRNDIGAKLMEMSKKFEMRLDGVVM